MAILVEPQARMLAIDLRRAGGASDYRGPDFRKPINGFFTFERVGDDYAYVG